MMDSLSLGVAYFSVITRPPFLPVARASEDYEEAVRRMGKRPKNQSPCGGWVSRLKVSRMLVGKLF